MTASASIKATLKLMGRFLPRQPGHRIVALCYHSVHPSLPYKSATPQLFAEHLAWLREHCDCIPFNQIMSARPSNSDRPRVSITFDDGYADNYEFALPSLVDCGIPATFFLTAGLLENDPPTLETFRTKRKVGLGTIQPLMWGQVGEMIEAGMDVGAHGYSHANLACLKGPELAHELVDAKRIIENRVGQEVRMMAYPFGQPRVHFTDRVVKAVQHAGYDMAAAIVTRGVKKTDDPLRVPRIFVTNDSVELLRDKVLGVWDLIGTVRENVPLAVARIISPADFSL